MSAVCSVDGCTRPHRAKGVCSSHYMRLQRGAEVNTPLRRYPEFHEMYRVSESGCWEWLGAPNASGYGKFRDQRAHRVSYEKHVGPIPAGLQLDHLCRNRMCVNPSHLEPVTSAENTRRGFSPTILTWRRNVCAEGHDMTGAYVTPSGARRCRLCVKARLRGVCDVCGVERSDVPRHRQRVHGGAA